MRIWQDLAGASPATTFHDFTSLAGRKRSADHVSSMAICVTGRMPALITPSQPMSRVMSVLTFELFFGYENHSNPPGFKACFAVGSVGGID